jgi:photosystem II stability/assembly factor-like uncharacterized protein
LIIYNPLPFSSINPTKKVMKNLVFACVLFCIALPGMSQFVPQPLNYPGPGYWPFYISITDPDHVWIGTFHESGFPYSFSAKTTDGGDSWIFDSIPVPGVPGCASICAWDANTCFHVYDDINGTTDPSIWKTTDGGTSWTSLITTQFTGSYINFYHAFSADTGLAIGDPRDGYFEIQRTFDGGSTWTRVPSSNIPAPLASEMGLNHSYSAVGNSIWFTTSKVRCFRSTDRGQTWDVTEVVPGAILDLGVCFSTEQKGAIWNRSANTNPLVVTNDGGVSWDTVSFPNGYTIMDMSRVPGLAGGFVVTAYKAGMSVYFTPDMFNTLQVLESGIISIGSVEFYDASTGWLGGGESGNNEIFKYAGILNGAQEKMKERGRLTILPNPSVAEALIRLQSDGAARSLELCVTDMAGMVIYREFIRSANKWVTLNSSIFPNGIYLVTVLEGKDILGRGKWVVNH